MCGGDDVYDSDFLLAIRIEINMKRRIGCSRDPGICSGGRGSCFAKKSEEKRKEKFPIINNLKEKGN